VLVDVTLIPTLFPTNEELIGLALTVPLVLAPQVAEAPKLQVKLDVLLALPPPLSLQLQGVFEVKAPEALVPVKASAEVVPLIVTAGTQFGLAD
tara:strand:- start:8 stop:289 length:282 start_codon:yes stop_codon:yes gene_type:complete